MGFINYKSPDSQLSPSLNITDLDIGNSEVKVAKTNDGTLIKFPEAPAQAEPEKPYFDDQALEGGLVLPFTPMWRLLETSGNMAAKGAGKIIGSIMDMSRNKGIPAQTSDIIKGGTREELYNIEQTLKNVGKTEAGDELGDELLGIPGMTPSQGNFFERGRYFNTAIPRMESKIRKETKKIFSGSPELQEGVVNATQKAYKMTDDKVKAAYQKVEDMGDDAFRYDARPMRDNILKTLADEGFPEPVIRNIKRNLFYRERNLSPAQKGAQKMLPKLDDEFQEAATDLTLMVPNAADGRKNVLKEAEKLVEILRIQKPADRSVGLSELNAAIKKYKSTKTRMEDVDALLPDMDNIGEKEFIRLIREVNRKKNVGGGDMGKYDLEEQAGLRRAKGMIEDYFEMATSKTNPGISGYFKEARKEYAQKVQRYGHANRGNENFPELGKMVKKPYEAGQEIDNEAQVGSLLNSTAKIKHVGGILDEVQPGTTKQMANEWLSNKLGTVRQGDRGLVDLERADLPSLRNQLDDIVSDDRAMKFITDTLGPEKAAEINALHGMVSSVNSLVKEVAKEGMGRTAKTPMEYIKEGTGKMSTLGRTLKIAVDYFKDSGTTGKYGTEVMQRVSQLVERVQKSKGYVEKSRAATELETFLKGLKKTSPAITQQAEAPDLSVPDIGSDSFDQLVNKGFI